MTKILFGFVAAAALAIDHYGLMGMPREPITWARVAGLLFVGAGVMLLRGA